MIMNDEKIGKNNKETNENNGRNAKPNENNSKHSELLQKFRVQQIVKIKLEIMPLPVLKFLMNFIFLVGILGLATPLLMAIGAAYIATWGFSNSNSANVVKGTQGGQEAVEYTKTIFGVEGALRSISCLMVFFLLISYPIRILLQFLRVREKVVNEQLLEN